MPKNVLQDSEDQWAVIRVPLKLHGLVRKTAGHLNQQIKIFVAECLQEKVAELRKKDMVLDHVLTHFEANMLNTEPPKVKSLQQDRSK